MITDSSEPGGSFIDLQRMIAELDREIAEDPTNALAHDQRGNAYAQLKQYQRAVSDYSRALELDPACTVAYVHRGQAFAALGYHQWAATDFSRAEALVIDKEQLMVPPTPVAHRPGRAVSRFERHVSHLSRRWLGLLVLCLALPGLFITLQPFGVPPLIALPFSGMVSFMAGWWLFWGGGLLSGSMLLSPSLPRNTAAHTRRSWLIWLGVMIGLTLLGLFVYSLVHQSHAVVQDIALLIYIVLALLYWMAQIVYMTSRSRTRRPQ